MGPFFDFVVLARHGPSQERENQERCPTEKQGVLVSAKDDTDLRVVQTKESELTPQGELVCSVPQRDETGNGQCERNEGKDGPPRRETALDDDLRGGREVEEYESAEDNQRD
jgi:hypothetical protein